MIKLAILAITVASLTATANSQTLTGNAESGLTPSITSVPASLPTTTAQLRSEGLKRIAHLGGNLYGNFLLYDNNTRVSYWADWDGGANPTAIVNFIRNQWYSFRSSNPEHDQMWTFSYFYDASYRPLFSMANAFRLERSGSRWRVPAEAWMAEIEQLPLPFDFPDAFAARVVTVDGRTYSIDVQNGVIMIPTNIGGFVGQILVYTYNQNTGAYNSYAYDLTTGQLAESVTICGYFNTAGFKDVVAVSPNAINILVASENGRGISPLITTAIYFHGSYTIKALTSEGEMPKEVIIERIGEVTTSVPFNGNAKVSVNLPPGLYHLRLVWNHLREPEPPTPVVNPPLG
jgi:hypothetical protein